MTTTPNGDTIADQVKRHQSTDTNLSDVAHSLTDAHAHRPGMWQQDLAKANDAMHNKGLLPGLDLVGVRGQDLVTRDGQGHVQLVDSTDTKSRHSSGYSGGSTWQAQSKDIGGRSAGINPDGSGTVKAQSGDNSPWVLSQAVLKSQGIDNPTPNQMANYQMELEKANNKKVSQIKPGDDIQIPPFSQAGGQTDFRGDRAGAQAATERTSVNQQFDEATAALRKFGYNLIGDNKMTQADIQKALGRNDLTPADQRGLQFMNSNYDQLSTRNSNGHWSGISDTGLDNGRTKAQGGVQDRLAAAIGYDQ